MDPQPPTTSATARTTTEASPPQPPKPSPSLPPPSSSSAPPISAPNPNPNPNPNPSANPNPAPGPSSSPSPIQAPNPKPSTPTPSQPRPPQSFNRTLPPPSQPQFPHFSSAPPPSPSPTASAAAPRGGMAIGVPAHHQSPSPPFSSSFGQHFGGLGRTGVNVAESTSTSSTSQVRTPVQGMGMLGSQMRPSGIAPHPQRPVQQSSLRPPSSAPNTQPAGSQSFQGHGLMRSSSVGSPATPSPSASQGVQSLNQPWLSSGPQGKPPLPSTAYRQQLNPQSMQQRSHIPPPQQSTPTSLQQPQPQQPLLPNQSQEHFGQQVPPSRVHVPHQQQVTRLQGPGNQKPSSLVAAQSNAVQSGIQSRLTNADADESSNSILGKRSIHELVNQVDPLEKLEPEVADILVDISENFLESIIRSGCSLAKHRKSTTLEAKDILLHLEKNWNLTLPGFGGDEIKSYRRPITSDIHKERLAAIKKSMAATEAAAHGKGSAGQASGSAKGGQAKTPLNIIGSPNVKNS